MVEWINMTKLKKIETVRSQIIWNDTSTESCKNKTLELHVGKLLRPIIQNINKPTG